MNVDKITIDSSWKTILKDELSKPYFDSLVYYLKTLKKEGKIIYPPGQLIFNAFNTTPFEEVKVVILGQDPYHGPDQAMGLSFSVPQNQKIPPSLKNIFKELHEDVDIEIPNHGDLSYWASQGVFLLNAILTVEHKKPGSHRKIGWIEFTDAVITKISELKENVVFMLWGNFAKTKKSLIDTSKHLVLTSSHPSPLARGGFFNNHHFSLCNQYLLEHHGISIDWQL